MILYRSVSIKAMVTAKLVYFVSRPNFNYLLAKDQTISS